MKAADSKATYRRSPSDILEKAQLQESRVVRGWAGGGVLEGQQHRKALFEETKVLLLTVVVNTQLDVFV